MENAQPTRLSLHQIVIRDLPPIEVVRLAAELECSHVCLFTQPVKSTVAYPDVADQDVAGLRSAMDGLGIALLGATSFPMTPSIDIGSYAAGLERAARLGGTIASVRIVDDDRARAGDNFARFAELAHSHGIEPCIEFMGYRATDALDRTLDVIRAAGAGKLSLDALHIVRTGTSIDRLRALKPDLIGYVQICDGPLEATEDLYAREGGLDRAPPGEGEFPLQELIAIAAGRPLSLEVPQEGLLQAGVSARDRARRAVEGARRVIDRLQGDSRSQGLRRPAP